MAETTDLVVKFKGKEFHVPEGFTAEEYKESVVSAFPEAANAKLIKDSEVGGKIIYTLKPMYAEKG